MNEDMDQMLDSNTVIKVPEYLNIRIKADEIDPAVFKLVVTKCFATPSDDRYNMVNYTFFDDSCPLEHDIIVASNGIGNSVDVRVQSFTFNQMPESEIFIHCRATLCEGQDCVPQCGQSMRKRRSVSTEAIGVGHVDISLGPIVTRN